MSNVPRHSRTRHTHGRVARRSHDHSGYLPAITGASEVYEQLAIDGVVGVQNILPGSVTEAAIRDRALSQRHFLETLRPVAIVDELPALPHDDYPIGSTVVLTTDGKLYRNVIEDEAETWSKAVDGADLIANSVTAGAISAGAITTDALAVGATLTGNFRNAAIGATVVADSEGLHIFNGALTFEDAFGQTALTGAGFGRQWVNYIALGFYNATFEMGGTGGLGIPVSEVSSGLGEFYEASLSPYLPYWVVSQSDGILNVFDDAESVGGRVLHSSGGGVNAVYQDIPILPGSRRPFYVTYKGTVSSGNVQFSVWYRYMAADHTALSSRTLLGQNDHTISWDWVTVPFVPPDVAPEGCAYVRYEIEIFHSIGGSSSVQVGHVSAPLTFDPAFGTISAETITNERSSTVEFDGVDVSMSGDLEVAGEIEADTLRLTSTGDAGLASLTHAFQVGPDTGLNIIMDQNEIMARSNGSISDLHLQTDGGIVTLGQNANPTSASHGLRFGNDVQLYRIGANSLKLATGDRFDYDGIGRSIVRTSNFNVSNNVWTRITGWTNTAWAGLETSFVNDSIRVNVAGVYLIFAELQVNSSTSTRHIIGPVFGANAPPINTPNFEDEHTYDLNGSTWDRHIQWVGLRYLDALTNVGIAVNQNSGGTLAVEYARLSVVRVGV